MESVAEDWRHLSTEDLMAKKDAIEAEMSACNTVLESVSVCMLTILILACAYVAIVTLLIQQGSVGMHGRLVDSEGYPRADIDVYAVRTARHKIICESSLR